MGENGLPKRLPRWTCGLLAALTLLAAPPLAAAGSTLLSMTSDPGEYVGGGQTYYLTHLGGTFTATGSSAAGVTVSFDGTLTSWTLHFVPPAGRTLEPGMFEGATRWPFQSPTEPGLDVTGNSRSCSPLSGRFVVLEAQFGPGGEVTSFAADFEQHCELGGGWSPALIGSVRFDSTFGTGTRISAAPASSYEGDVGSRSMRFWVSLSARSVDSISVDYATADGSAKAATDYTATQGSLTFPPGYTALPVDVPILGNTAVEADRTFTLSLTNPAGAPIAFGQATGTILDDDTGKTFLDFASDPGDYVGGGQTFTLTPLDGTITPTRHANDVQIAFQGSTWWYLQFFAPMGSPLLPGVYEVEGYVPSPATPALNVFGDGRSCGYGTGRFVVLEVTYAVTGEVQSFAADYESHCYGLAPALFGSVRFNSLVPRGPRLSVAPAAVFEGDGEPVSLTFRVSLSQRVATDVSADFATTDGTAAAGTDYTATSGHLVIPAGQTAAQVNVPVLGNTTPQPDRSLSFALSNATGATLASAQVAGAIVDDDAIRTQIRMDSEEGDYIGAGRHFTLRPPLDGTITTVGGQGDLDVQFRGFMWWEFHVTPPAGRTLTVGAFEGATRWPFQLPTVPGLAVSGEGRGCNGLTGRFDVLQADYGPSGEVQALAIDLEQHCEGQAPALFASIRVNSTIPIVKRPAPPKLVIAFGAASIPLGGSTTLTFTLTNPNPQDALTSLAVVDALPAGLVVSTPNGLTGSCGGGTIGAAAGSGSISLTGATLPGGGSCTFSASVTGSTAGFKNDVATVTSAETAPGKTATASLKVGVPAPLLFFKSEPGDGIGLGQTFTLTEADGALSVTASPQGAAYAHFNTPSYSMYWDLSFTPPSGVAFAPGVYEGANSLLIGTPLAPALNVNGNGRGCSTMTGRFVVLEAQYSAAGELQVLAVDYEQHCNGAPAALFGSVRYNSLLPVEPRISVARAIAYEGDGEPRSLAFKVSLSTPAAGVVTVDYTTADGSAKAGTDYTATAGTATFATGQTVAVVNVPILGNVAVEPNRDLNLVLGNPSGAPIAFGFASGTILDDDAGRTFLDLASDPGDWAGGGLSFTWTPLDATFTAVSAPGLVSVTVRGTDWWFLNFAGPAVTDGSRLAPGVYEGATRFPFQSPAAPGLSVGGGGCNTLTGRFVVLEVEYGPSNQVTKLAVDFEQHCEGAAPALLGSIRINSLLSAVPRLSVAPAAAYEGNGEAKSLPFRLSLSRRSASTVSVNYATLDGTAKAGTDYTAESGTAIFAPGQTSARVDVPILGNRTPQSDRTLSLWLESPIGVPPVAFGQATGVILDDDSARTLLYLQADPGAYLGPSQPTTLTPLDGPFFVTGYPSGQVLVQFVGTPYWTLNFSPPTGGAFAAGAYEHAMRFPNSSPPTPGLDVYGGGVGCNTVAGRFVVLEAVFAPAGNVLSLAIDFEQHCDGQGPALFGSVRYNSAVPVVPRALAAGAALLSPCRALDTRKTGEPLQPGEERTIPLAGKCGIPVTATALIANVTVTNPTQPGFLNFWRADGVRPSTNGINFTPGRTRANNAIVAVSSEGTASITIGATTAGTVDVVLDVSGYFQ